MPKIIITGSEGFIGKNLKKKFNNCVTVDFIESAELKPFEFLSNFKFPFLIF